MRHLAFDASACTACRTCEIVCTYGHAGYFQPTAAGLVVTLDRRTGAIALKFNDRCDGCPGRERPLCVEFCAPGSLSVAR